MSAVSESVKVVSFDLFDTLVLRPIMRPMDLFKLVGQIYFRDDFFEYRIKAETEARSSLGTEVTLDEIYSFMPDDLAFLKDTECQIEIDLCFRNPWIQDLYNSITEGRKVIITTDMYLPRVVIETILQKNRIGYDGLYISAEHRKTKHSGSLFEYILKELSIRPEEMVHIGDNKHADYKIPKRMGIQTVFVESPFSEYLRTHPDERRFYKRNRSLTSSVILFMDMIREKREDAWEDMGNRYGGPLNYSFAKHICDNHKDSSIILFTARDGYSLMQSVRLMDSTIESYYVHAQRILSEMIGSDISDIQVPSRISDSVEHKRAIYLISKVLKFYLNNLELLGMDERQMIQKYHDSIDRILESQKQKYQSYQDRLNEICSDRDVEIVDCTTMKMTSQRFIQKVLGRDVYAHYLVTLGREKNGLKYDSLCNWPYNVIGWERVDVPEFLLCSPEMPIIGWDDGPIYDIGPHFEKVRADNYQKMSDAELSYVQRMMTYFGDHLPAFDYMVVNKWVMLSTAKGTRYRDLLSTVKCASNPDHSDWAPIIPWDDIPKSISRLMSEVVARINHR